MKYDQNTQWRAPHRGAYWRAGNRATGGILLTLRDHAACSATELAHIAHKTASDIGIRISCGFIVVLDADGTLMLMTET